MSTIIKDTLHPENESGTDIYPKTSSDQVEGYGKDLNGNDFALANETCKKPINIGTPTHVLGVEGGSSNQPISILIGNDRNNIPKRNVNGNIESLKDATNNNEYVRKGQFDKGLSEVSAPVVNITDTSTATQGTISASDLQVLQGNKSAIVRFNNELYYFMDDEYKSGYLTYSHVGVDASVQWVKSITITISSLSWVLTKSQVGGGGTKLYKHTIGSPPCVMHIFSSKPAKYTYKTDIVNDIMLGKVINMMYHDYTKTLRGMVVLGVMDVGEAVNLVIKYLDEENSAQTKEFPNFKDVSELITND